MVVTALNLRDFGVQKGEDHLRWVDAALFRPSFGSLVVRLVGVLRRTLLNALLAAHLPPRVLPHRVYEPTRCEQESVRKTASNLRDECRLDLLERHGHQRELEVAEVVASGDRVQLVVALDRLLVVELVSEIDLVELQAIQLVLRCRPLRFALFLDENRIIDILIIVLLMLLLELLALGPGGEQLVQIVLGGVRLVDAGHLVAHRNG